MNEDLLSKLKRVLKIDDNYYSELYDSTFQHSMDVLNTTEPEDVSDALQIEDAKLFLRNTQADLSTFFLRNNLSAYILGKLAEDGMTEEEISKCLDMYDDEVYKKFLASYQSAAYEYSQIIIDTINAGVDATNDMADSGNVYLN